MALSQLDQINKTQEGVRKLRESIPGPAYDPPEAFAPKPAAPAARPAVSAQPGAQVQSVRPKRTFPTQVGQYAQGRVNATLHGAEQLGDMATFNLRRGLGGVRDAYKAFTGGANPNEGQMVGSNFDFGRVGGPSAPTPAAPAAVGTPAAPAARPAAIVSDGSAGTPANPYVKPAAAAAPAAPVANAVQDSGMPAGITKTFDSAGNPIYSGTGASVAAAGGPPQGSTVVGRPTNYAMPQRSLPPDVVAPSNMAGQYQVRGRQGGIIENPANGSVADQITRAIGSPSLKGSPSARAAVAQAILQQAGFANDERQSALRTGDQADLQSINNNANANENFARRRFDASKFNVGVDLQAQELEASQRVPFEQQPILRGLDGGTSVLHRDGTLSALTNKDGTPFRVLDPSQRTTVSPDAEFKALTDELTAMSQFPGDGTEQRRGQIQARMAQLTGQGGQAKQVRRTGTLDGRRVVEYQDGTKAFLD
ncbi:hypothetical protein CSC74_03145 [Pseudoxanthomonas yeongjuensis]|uniref:hypothetical protein n=1 Tax=Pseudoxanthomonas yeongjuensis TaxID=377616 RepID=UPI001390F8C2|nr:hypothetical protein [Pseudoxanthomonas yeongjuensis]KAF1717917.1 hypothetical protein CSC74_03145 [Pseudoxanthomonas yeongjuensis]